MFLYSEFFLKKQKRHLIANLIQQPFIDNYFVKYTVQILCKHIKEKDTVSSLLVLSFIRKDSVVCRL